MDVLKLRLLTLHRNGRAPRLGLESLLHLGAPSKLRRLFLGELWRGRDNLRVTLRGPLTLRALPSVLLPVANLGALLACVPETAPPAVLI